MPVDEALNIDSTPHTNLARDLGGQALSAELDELDCLRREVSELRRENQALRELACPPDLPGQVPAAGTDPLGPPATQDALQKANEELQERVDLLEARNEHLERVMANMRTAQSEAWGRAGELDAILAALPIGITIFDPEHRIVRMNQASQAMFARTLTDEQMPFDDRLLSHRFTWPDGRLVRKEEIASVRALSGETVRNQVIGMFGTRGQAPMWLSISAAPLRSCTPNGDQIVGAIATLVDVSEMRALEERLQQANEELEVDGEQLQLQAEELQARNLQLAQLSAEIEAQRTRLQIILQKMPAGVLVADRISMQLILASEQMFRMWRRPVPTGGGMETYQAFPSYHADGRPYRPDEMPLARATLGGESVEGEEIEFLRGDDTWGTMLVNAEPIRDREGQITGGVSIALDVTERKEMEKELRRTRDELKTVLSIVHHLSSELHLDPLLQMLLDELKRLIDYHAATIYILEGRQFSILAYRGPLAPEDVLELSFPVEETFGLVDVIRGRVAVVLPDIEADTEQARGFRRQGHPVQKQLLAGARSWMAVPLVVRDRVIGILRLDHRDPGYFGVHQVQWGLELGSHLAVAIENTRVYDQAGELAVIEERQRLARDLHDVVSQILFSATLVAEVLPRIWEQDASQVPGLLEELRSLTRGAQAEMRLLLLELRPQYLQGMGLDLLLRHLAEAATARGHLHVSLQADENLPALPAPVQVALYRISQEAFNNIVKHARARNVAVDLCWARHGPIDAISGGGPAGTAQMGRGSSGGEESGTELWVLLSIADDGIGFDPQSVPAGRMGLQSMRERAAEIGAALDITTRPGGPAQIGSEEVGGTGRAGGTIVTVTWPAAAQDS